MLESFLTKLIIAWLRAKAKAMQDPRVIGVSHETEEAIEDHITASIDSQPDGPTDGLFKADSPSTES